MVAITEHFPYSRGILCSKIDVAGSIITPSSEIANPLGMGSLDGGADIAFFSLGDVEVQDPDLPFFLKLGGQLLDLASMPSDKVSYLGFMGLPIGIRSKDP